MIFQAPYVIESFIEMLAHTFLESVDVQLHISYMNTETSLM